MTKKFKCDCVYPCADYPSCGGTKISFEEQPENASEPKFTDLSEGIQKDLFNHHTHGELCNPDEIVYQEATVVRIISNLERERDAAIELLRNVRRHGLDESIDGYETLVKAIGECLSKYQKP